MENQQADYVAREDNVYLEDRVLMSSLELQERMQLTASLEEFLLSDPNMIRCPKCHVFFEKAENQNNNGDEVVLGPNNREISPEAYVHRAEHRFRCRECFTEFCDECKSRPYHVGWDCEGYEKAVTGRVCRFCGGQISNVEASICDDSDCKDKYFNACKTQFGCGHFCILHKNASCLSSCTHVDCIDSLDSQNNEDYCNICWVECLSAAPCVKLDCGHIFHASCIENRINAKWPGARMNFGYCHCPLCKKEISCEYLNANENLKSGLNYEAEVKVRGVGQLKIEGMDKDDKVAKPDGEFYQDLESYALDTLNYYLCFKCKQPYYGGKKACDAEAPNQVSDDVDPESLLCVRCQGGIDCPIHKDEYLAFKCRFCCSVATFLCFGNTHFCTPCHNKPWEIVDSTTKQIRKDYVLPVCPGKELCPLKMEHPPNGEEFCLGCTMCAESQTGTSTNSNDTKKITKRDPKEVKENIRRGIHAQV